MKSILAAASLIAISASGAMASGTVTVSATIASYLEVDVIDPSITYDDVNAVSGLNSVGANIPTARFDVIANVDYDLTATFPTWQPVVGQDLEQTTPPTYEQAAFENTNGDLIGGSIYIDTTPLNGPNNTGTTYQNGAGDLVLSNQPAGVNDYGVGGQIVPRYSSTGAIPTPGTYSLDVVITVAAAGP